MTAIRTPFSSTAKRVLLLGSGELGREVAIELKRFGVEVLAADRYEHAPAMQVAHRSHVLDMLDGDALRSLIEAEKPNLIVPEVEAIATDTLAALEGAPWQGFTRRGRTPAISAGHQYLMKAAFAMDWHSEAAGSLFGPRRAGMDLYPSSASATPPLAGRPGEGEIGVVDRWSLDTSAFYRQGSGALSTSQGRQPVYGASQIAANLQYRIAPESRHDPRASLRIYHALVRDGETELAANVSARPVGALPLRFFGEVRATRNPSGTDYRPAGYAVTEIPSQRLPLRFALETYGAAGYVGGEADTYFAEGQAAVTREVVSFKGLDDQRMRLSFGGAAWGGAQKDASRFDIGPTLRLDLSVGEVPARISVDWRERVAGDAAPESGVAATVSTRF